MLQQMDQLLIKPVLLENMAKMTILSKENIKPRQPTCNPHPSIPLSLLDQLAPPIYTHILFFYSKYSPDMPEKLKSSLSQTLKYFYPFSGRIRETDNGKLYVECNNEGVEFVETQVVGASLESVRHGQAVEWFNDLLPIKKTYLIFMKTIPCLECRLVYSIQEVLYLVCPSVTLLLMVHLFPMFLSWWSRTASDISENLSAKPVPPRCDCALVFPPQEMTQSTPDKRCNEDSGANQDVAIRCFNINSEAMERLKKVDGGQPTRVEAVSALVWRCIKRVQAENILSLSHVINFRKIMAPLLSQESIGNMFITVEIKEQEDKNSFRDIEQNIRRVTRGVDEQFVRSKAQQMLAEREGNGKGQGTKEPERIDWIFRSWCRMGWYECNFGFEEPVWVACGITAMKNVCILLDAKDGHGMEVWLWMESKEMERIVSDHEFQKFVCFS